ncbi:hypothetical protein J14TS2_42580 [Bacillus sp. J14TS2]|nr:hypothetical protein J14TS2_42580 [Bacillus sp. J14TS2]
MDTLKIRCLIFYPILKEREPRKTEKQETKVAPWRVDHQTNKIHLTIKNMELKFVLPNMGKTFDNIELTGSPKNQVKTEYF